MQGPSTTAPTTRKRPLDALPSVPPGVSPGAVPDVARPTLAPEGSVPAVPALASTPPDPTPVPSPAGEHDLDRPEYYLNRELTWLNFNFRVLHEAEDSRTPLLERVNFLAIVGSNLDEFFMKRIGGLKQQVGAGITEQTVDGRTPAEQIHECCRVVRRLETRQRDAARDILAHLADESIRVLEIDELTPGQRKWIRNHCVFRGKDLQCEGTF